MSIDPIVGTVPVTDSLPEPGSVSPTVAQLPPSSTVTTPDPVTDTLPALSPADDLDALSVLETVPEEKEHPDGYDRALFPHWLDLDGDGCDTRNEILTRDSITPVETSGPCDVIQGQWHSPYDDITVSSIADVDIDHVVALKEAWDSGAWAWTVAQRTAYANDETDARALVAASSASNTEKGDRDPSNWMPSNRAEWCPYIGWWIAIKARWQLSMDHSERGRLENLLRRECEGLRIAAWLDTPNP